MVGIGEFAMRVILEVLSGPAAGRQVEILDGQAVRVGFRTPSEFLVPDDPWLFDVHFSLEYVRGRCRLQNLNPRAWTALNGVKVTGTTVGDGDRIVAGGTRFVVHVAEDAAAPVAAAHVLLADQPAPALGAV